MDFASILNVAQKNTKSGSSSESGKYYSTKFGAPKKESKEKRLSANIKRFLVQKEEEERQKELEAKQKYTELMSQRSEKDKNKIRKMLKVTKSANKSVLADAVNSTDTAVTLQGPEQPDEDDYGYVSQEASSLYKNLMEKYKSIPEDKKFSDSSGHVRSQRDLLSTKDRVKAAILREREEEKLGRKRLSQHSSSSSTAASSSREGDEHRHRSRKNLYDPQAEREGEERRRREEDEDRRKQRFKKPPPPVMDFKKLLQLAEQKQHEPVEIDVPEKHKEPERLLTKKEKRDMEEKMAYLKEKERRQNPSKARPAERAEQERPTNKMAPNGRIPKLNSASAARPQSGHSEIRKPSSSASSSSSSSSLLSKQSHNQKLGHKSSSSTSSLHSSANKNGMPASSNILKSALTANSKSSSSTSKPSATYSKDGRSRETEVKMQDRKRDAIPKGMSSRMATTKDIKPREFPPRDLKAQQMSSKDVKPREFPPKDVKPRGFPCKEVKTGEFPPKDIKTREFPPKDIKTREFPPRDIKTREFPPKDIKTREFPPKDIKTREFPPKDVRRNGNGQMLARKPQMPGKRRMDDYYDDSEYDSEMDDFIDDGDDCNDYSKHIKEIFGYDKSRYRHLDENVDDMESSFAQQQKEEYRSKRIGLMEDLEDMRMEAEEKKRKAKRRRLSDD